MKHFFALYKDPFGNYVKYVNHIKAMINSANQNTTLESYFIYDGEKDDLTDWLETKGVTTVYHKSELADVLESHTRDGHRPYYALGAYLRIDIPVILNKLAITDPVVMYTDCDVLFAKEVTYDNLPSYFAITPEFNHTTERPYFNTGVMFINTEQFMASREDLLKFINAENLYRFGDYDQGALNQFYEGKFSVLEWNYNWRPYYGINHDAIVIHFHGLKIGDIEIAINKKGHEAPVLDMLYKNNPEAYLYYLEMFKSYLHD